MAVVGVTGLVTMDFLFSVPEMPARPEKYRSDHMESIGGGGGANAAVAMHRLGADVRFMARIGGDAVGDMILDNLAGEGLSLGGIHRYPDGRSSCSSVLVDGAGERQIVNFRGAGLADDPYWMDLSQPFDAVMADTRWPDGALALFNAARVKGVPAVLDAEAPVHGEVAAAASHVAFSEQGLRDFTGIVDVKDAVLRAAAVLDGWVCVTLGARGVMIADGATVEIVPAFPVDVVDTLGAGDVWHGAFTLCLAEGADEVSAARFANAAAALKCRRFGGRAAAPTRPETDAFLAGV